MRSNVDFSPFYRSSVGFDRIFNLLENSAQPQGSDKWPPYDIVKLGEDKYRIVIAVAGFKQDELTITHEPNLLVIKGDKLQDKEGVQYLHHGLALRPFIHRFELADHVTVTDAQLDTGLLIVELKKEIPEEMKPRRIAISGAGNTFAGESSPQRQVMGDRAA
ncbi:Hsp20 family protein [Phyllobacterium sp. SYP-B3895]|uniref:Hsp20 family protein n=1 Tax=Phyllobacterium sp. SYP-B3895 TaxID=2663240 RepID=UPI00129A01A1|nr:Hsp20 family protein [Phyllobacterium sp. SYP-B3895]MRG54585.1 Hsp20 family protein [Phyllobacterium sp. SYP-B3895]